MVAAGTDHILALKSDGTVWAWGKNTYGQLGNGDTNDTEYPAKVHSRSVMTAMKLNLLRSQPEINSRQLFQPMVTFIHGAGTNTVSLVTVLGTIIMQKKYLQLKYGAIAAMMKLPIL
jgi:hypothetical protein